jgi:hypothetical protein
LAFSRAATGISPSFGRVYYPRADNIRLGELMIYLPDFAALSKEYLARAQSLEKELKVVLLALKPSEYAQLPPEKLKKLQSAEKELGVTIIAYH